VSEAAPGRHRGRPQGSTRYAQEDAAILDQVADLLVAAPTLSAAGAIRQVTGKPNDQSLIHRLRGKLKRQSAITYLHPRGQRKAERTPILRVEFLDLPEHENLGAIGFRHIQSRLELLVSIAIRNVGPVAATDLRLDIYHFVTARTPAVHEISSIRVVDALQSGESLQWSKSISLADLTVDGPYYKSGSTGIFSDYTAGHHYHYHVVFSFRNTRGEEFSAIFCMERIVVNNVSKGNRMVFVGPMGRYNSKTQFPAEWRNEIEAKELSLRHLMAAQTGTFASVVGDF
jgi:hypothetical protein